MTLRVFIVVEMNDFDWYAAHTGVLSNSLSERRASKAGKEKSYRSFREMHDAIVAEGESLRSLRSLPWPGASSEYIFLHLSIMAAENVIAASAGPRSTSRMGRRKKRLGSGAWGKDVDEIVRGWSAVSALLLG